MISLIVYGRNDSYGYNLHKRAALSLNNFGELLTDPSDEILFVDYNTPSGYPTFPEAIIDTLTPKALKLLRVIRVSEQHHASLGIKTHLKTLEPIARNVALRRSNPNNRWVLSTNTDMIFVPRKRVSISEIVSDLEDGHYGLPRFELPEGLWEGYPRQDPIQVISQLGRDGWRFHLNQVARSWSPHLFDAPGDFQLMLRADLLRIDGFDESMVLGWHVDSNVSKRISLLRGPATDLSDVLFGYHCDHTRQETPMHAAGAPQNSTFVYIDAVDKPGLPRQEHNWGLSDQSLREIRLKENSPISLASTLASLQIPSQTRLEYRRYTAEGFDRDAPKDFALAPFLFDLIISAQPLEKIIWIGPESELKSLVRSYVPHSKVTFEDWDSPNGLGSIVKIAQGGSLGDWLVIDFRARNQLGVNGGVASFHYYLLLFVIAWTTTFSPSRHKLVPLRIIGIDAINTSAEGIFNTFVRAARTPYVVGFRHGQIIPLRASVIWRSGLIFARHLLKSYRARLFPDTSVAGLLARWSGLRFAARVFHSIVR